VTVATAAKASTKTSAQKIPSQKHLRGDFKSRGDSNAAINCKILQITASSNSIFFIVMQNNNF
jgi:hypothetical protein